MPLFLVTAPNSEPITLAEAKAQVRVLHSDEDQLIQGYIAAARNYVENKTWRQLMRATLQLRMDRFPTERFIVLPRPRLVSVSSVRYRGGGEWATLATERYQVDSDGEPGRLRAWAAGWPSCDDELGAVQIEYVCGWTADQVPPQVKTALLMLVAGYYQNRDGEIPDAIFRTVDTLIEDFQVRSLAELPYLQGTNESLTAIEGVSPWL
jgi:uncharacterized phiE125 gp8 family phage protein